MAKRAAKPTRRTLVFDTETTQLINNSLMPLGKQPRVTEFCGIIIDDSGKHIDRLEFLCNPGISIPEEAAKITGLTDEILAKHPPFAARFPEVKSFIEIADMVVAHNLSYDFAVINFEAARAEGAIVWPKPSRRICTVEATEHVHGHRLGLTALHEHLFKEPFPSAHRAGADVEALVRCVVELRKQGLL
jgi:DNA polymerase III epsilon subunit-like protein